MRGRVLLVVLTVVVLAPVAFGGGVAQRLPKTLATFRGPVVQFAQSGRYLAWLARPRASHRETAYGATLPRGAINWCGVLPTFLDLRTGRRMTARGWLDPNQFCDPIGDNSGGADWMALAGRRVYWQVSGGSNNMYFEDLLTEAAGQTQSSYIDYQSLSNGGPT